MFHSLFRPSFGVQSTSIGCSGLSGQWPQSCRAGARADTHGTHQGRALEALSLGNLAELKDCAWPHGWWCGQGWEPQCGEVPVAVHSIGLVTSRGAVPPHREQLNFSSANSRLAAPMKLQVRKLCWEVAVLHPGSHGLQPSDVYPTN